MESDDEIYEVERILDMRKRKNITEFLIRWKGFDESFDSWEPRRNLGSCQERVAEFLEKQVKANEPPPPPPAKQDQVFTSLLHKPLIREEMTRLSQERTFSQIVLESKSPSARSSLPSAVVIPTNAGRFTRLQPYVGEPLIRDEFRAEKVRPRMLDDSAPAEITRDEDDESVLKYMKAHSTKGSSLYTRQFLRRTWFLISLSFVYMALVIWINSANLPL